MAIEVIAIHPNPSVPANLTASGVRIMSGVAECSFRGDASGNVLRDTISFDIGRVNLGTGGEPQASCTMSLASFAFDGNVDNALWAVDEARVTGYSNVDRGSGTADLRVRGNLAVRGAGGLILRVSYCVAHVI